MYVDGGVLNNLPADILSDMGADVVIASDVVHVKTLTKKPDHLIDVADRTIDIMTNAMTERQLGYADVIITPEVERFHSTQFSRHDTLVMLGYYAAKQKMDAIEQRIQSVGNGEEYPHSHFKSDDLETAILRKVMIHGQKNVRARVIRSEVTLAPGDTFTVEESVNSIQNIYATGLFEYVSGQVEYSDNRQVIFHIEVKEKYPRTISFGLNYFSDYGVSGFFQIVHFNLLGWGERFMPILRLGQTERKLGIEVYNDRLFSTPVTLNNAVYYQEETPYVYNAKGTHRTQIRVERALAQFGIGAQFSKNSLISLGIQRERVWIKNAGKYLFGSRTDELINLYGKYVFDTTNDPHTPTRGAILQLEATGTEVSGGQPGSYSRVQGQWRRYQQFSNRFTVSTQINFGLNEKSAPFYQYYRIGGVEDLPGFHRDELWGKTLTVLGVQPRYKISKTLYLETIFALGNVYGSPAEITLKNMVAAMSVGIRIPLPVGPVQLHYGYNDLGRSIWYSSVGYSF